mmetsp:Transcript_2896/g.4683  ORF Transcript_2896/g.4683 Transcript_2896/m.4683 type:complete len:226 (-) Transcript_2896:168-845(-)|eukprot:CAMPEP_0119013674 /NCGR_PEP_ID=MMETSP1176-20130426/8727_1 /TAXON_ID=265551 /ORGANISM="Synedropsis recta cf, Strain CCMP1620" /LENGTH=225 /DNA_ID=CAMNT_0006966781 /DNA_START=59 /DNA_END=736 /DNA_ORIENTATION=+
MKKLLRELRCLTKFSSRQRQEESHADQPPQNGSKRRVVASSEGIVEARQQQSRRKSRRATLLSASLQQKKEQQLLKDISKIMKQSKEHVYQECLLPRYMAFLKCLRRNRTVSVDPKAIKVYNQQKEKNKEDDESFWLDTRGKGYKYFHAYLTKWDVAINLEFYNAVTALLSNGGTNHRNKSSKSARGRHVQQHFPTVFDTYLREDRVFITPIQKSKIDSLHAQLT